MTWVGNTFAFLAVGDTVKYISIPLSSLLVKTAFGGGGDVNMPH